MNVNPSATPAAASRANNKPAASNQTKGKDFDALLASPDDLSDAEAPALDTLAQVDGFAPNNSGLSDVSPHGRETEGLEQRKEEQQQPTHVAEDAARAAMLPGNRELRPEATSEITPRRILHVVDMEKIVATVRTQTFSGNEAQATIQLSHSILNGLSITLQTDARGRVSAEITATTEAAKRIVDAHARELNEMLQRRGLDVASFSTKLSEGDTGTASGGEGGASSQSSAGRRGFAEFAADVTEVENADASAPVMGGEGIYTA